MRKFKVVLFISMFTAVVAYAFQSKTIQTNDGDSSVVTAATLTDTTEVLYLTSEENAFVTTSLSGGAATLWNHYQGKINESWVTMARDALSAVGVDTYNLRLTSTVNMPVSQFRIIRTITNSSGTQTLVQNLTSY